MSGQSRRVAVFGAGYVGLVTGACFADLGHHVVVRDVDAAKIDRLKAGRTPIYEPGLEELLERNRERLRFTLDVAEAVDGAEFVYVAVGTPPTYSGDADLSAVWKVVDELPDVDRRLIVVMKSTVPVGTGEKVRHRLDERGLTSVGYVSNPEFTAEGTAVRDFVRPDRIVVGSFREEDGQAVAELHQGIDAPIVHCDVASAEMIKLAANAALMTRISFINEIANVCEATGADVVKVAEGIGLDRRIGPGFLRAGIGYGGSCLVGEETVLVRDATGARLVSLETLYDETQTGDEIELLTWRPDAEGAEFRRVEVLTRRWYEGDVVEVRTKMGRRVVCTPDHPFVTAAGPRLAEDLTTDDWVPLAQHVATPRATRTRPLFVRDRLEGSGLTPADVIVRPDRDDLAGVGEAELRRALAARQHLELAVDGTARNGTYIPLSLDADAAFWRVVGLYIAEGCCPADARHDRHRLQWSFHPRAEQDLVDEVVAYWRRHGIKTLVQRPPTATVVRVSSRPLAAWWLQELRVGANSYDHRLPDLIWDESDEHKEALLAGLWLGDGSWSYVNDGPSVVLEYGTVSRELADGMLRLLGDLGIVARLKVGRTAKSTVDTYWLVVSGADQVERLLELVRRDEQPAILDSVARQSRRIAPTGFRRHDNAAWVRVVDVLRKPFAGFVYSLEVPPNHTFVTTGGLVVHNCFPKDSLALKQLAANSGYHFQLLAAVIEVNELQKRRVLAKLERHLGSVRDKTVALLGLAFKPNTDDMREAPSLVLAGRLLAEGARVRAWDPVARPRGLDGVHQVETVEEALDGADAAVLVTEWPQLAQLDWAALAGRMATPLLVDGRNMLEPQELRAAGWVYEGIGRAADDGGS